ncbi:MAG: Kelch repeat-containing protein [Candidatus Polarisedimenticolia bacterium]
MAILLGLALATGHVAPAASPRTLTFEQRVAAQRAIDAVYYRHQIGARLPFDDAVPRALSERKVRTYLRQSAALAITSTALRAEWARMARRSKLPDRLRELEAALGGDSFLIQECLVRPVLAQRLTRGLRDEPRNDVSTEFDVAAVAGTGPSPATSCQPDDVWESGALVPFPDPRANATSVWTGSHMILWGGGSNTGVRYDPATDSHAPISLVNAPQAGGNHTAVWTGNVMIVWGGTSFFSGAILATGGRYDPLDDSWTPTSMVQAPSPRAAHTALWTGSRMLVWGGFGLAFNTETDTGGLYDPATDTWQPTSTVGAAERRQGHRAVWTGNQMIVWGGRGPGGPRHSGGRYDPQSDSWLPMSIAGAPVQRELFTMVWAGGRVVLWGGINGGGIVGTGGRYDPAGDSWSATAPGPVARYRHSAVSTGPTMIIWGGYQPTGPTGSGSHYDPASNLWTTVSTTGAPEARYEHAAVWTGTTMIVWGGHLLGHNSAGRYVLASNQWLPSQPPPYPSPRLGHTAVWTGSHMINWGGGSNTGSRYDPALDAWSPTSTIGAPTARTGHAAVWTGDRMVVWGGTTDSTGGRYDPLGDSWSGMSLDGAPSPRSGHTAVWSGAEMIVWGGQSGPATLLGSGGRYDPALNSWTATSMAGAPSARVGHTAIWTDTRMIVWGGDARPTVATGARYDPANDQWETATSLTGAPAPRGFHSAVWTGSEMIVWGGYDNNGFREYPGAGGRYDPANDLWLPVSMVGQPDPPRENHTAVWTGSRMIIWGGGHCYEIDCAPYGMVSYSSGGLYDPGNNVWEPMSAAGAPMARLDHTAVWTGASMLVWGGQSCDYDNCQMLGNGAIYRADPSPDADDDSFHASCDCDDDDATIWAAPSEVPDLEIDADGMTLSWTTPSPAGGMSARYDTLRSADSSDFTAAAICLETDDGPDLVSIDPDVPPPGGLFSYLIRARNSCPNGTGPLGTSSDGTPRTGRACP